MTCLENMGRSTERGNACERGSRDSWGAGMPIHLAQRGANEVVGTRYLVIGQAYLSPSPPHPPLPPTRCRWSVVSPPVGDGLSASSFGGRGLVGDVATPAPASLNERVMWVRRYFPWGRRAPRLAMMWYCSSTASCCGSGGGQWRDGVAGWSRRLSGCCQPW